jgi:hypothetical protein
VRREKDFDKRAHMVAALRGVVADPIYDRVTAMVDSVYEEVRAERTK